MRIAGLSLVLAVLMTLWSAEVGAFPIDPQTLRMLTNGSELIVSACVEKITLIKREDGFNTGIARLNILSILKGAEESQSVDVYYEPDIVCPAQPHYEEGATVLAFLTRSQDGAGFVTVGLSYGAKSLNNRGIEVYSARIRELIEIEEQTDPNTRRERLVEWLVRCAEEPATRWEGAYDLRYSRMMKMLKIEMENERKKAQGGQEVAVDEGETEEPKEGVNSLGLEGELVFIEEDETEERKEEVVDLTAPLTEEQKGRLTAALYRASSLSNGVMDLIKLVESWGDENLVPFMWSYLKASKKDSPWETRSLMRELAALLKNQEAMELTEKFEGVIYSNLVREAQREQEGKAILQKFIEAIERTGAPRTVEINNEPEKPDDPPLQRSAKGGIGLGATLLAFAIVLVAVTAFRWR
jgi:hypothetical protein